MRQKNFFLVLTIVYSAFMPGQGLTQPKDAQAASRNHYGGTLVWGVCYKPTLINPIFTTQSVSASLESLIFNNLIRWNPKGEIEPDLAESWDISPDGLAYTFHLRKGVRFHDGVECTAYDVKFTFDQIIDPKLNSPFRSFFQLVSEFKAINKYTFQIILNKPSTSFIYRLIREIVPKHILEKSGDIKNSSFNFHPVGTGPYKFKEWTKDNQITLEYNPDYYEGRPYLDGIIIKTYPDSGRLWSALMRQEIDLSLFIERQNYEILKKDPAFKTYAVPIDYYYAIVYNLDDTILADKKVREAIAYAIDRKELIEKIGFGYGKECNGPFSSEAGFNSNVELIEFSPDKALSLLSESGWKDLDRDGILEKDGKQLEIRMLIDQRDEIYSRMAMMIRQELQVVGIKLTVQLYNDDKTLTPEFLEKNNCQTQLKLLLAGITPDVLDEVWSAQTFGRAYNIWQYKNEEVKRYFNLGKTTTDEKKREWIYREIHRFIYENQPVCFLFYPLFFHAVSSKIENTDDFFNLNMPVHTISRWFISHENSQKKGGDRVWN